MKNIFYFENEETSCLYNVQVIRKIRQHYPDDPIVMIGAGDFSSDGVLTEPLSKERSEEYVRAGADLVLSLPAASVLSGYGKKQFAGAALVQQLHVSEQLIIPCVPASGRTIEDCGKKLRSCAMLMLKEESGYRRRLTEYLNDKMPLRQAQQRSVSDCIPDSAELLRCPQNRQALWLLDSMLQLYYIPKVEFIAAPEYSTCQEDSMDAGSREADTASVRFDKAAALKTKELYKEGSMEKLLEISGSTTQIVSSFLKNRDLIRSADSFEQIIRILQPEPEDRVRLFLLKAVLGVRKIHMQICGLHEYVPYCYVSAKNQDRDDLLKQIEESSWVPFAGDDDKTQKIREEYSYLFIADERAGELTAGPDQKNDSQTI